MNELIDTKLVAKLMNKTAKECGMTRDDRCIVSQEVWLAKSREMEKRGAKTPVYYYYRYITKTYDFVADNFLELLAKRVEAEGFDLADNEPKVTTSKSICSDWENKQYLKDRQKWIESGRDYSKYVNVENYPKIRGKLYGSQYIRMKVAWHEKGRKI